MHNIILVIKHEIASTIGKPVFWLTTFVLPVVIMLLSLGAQFISIRAFQDEPALLESQNNDVTPQAIGYIDYADIIHDLPEGVPTDRILEFPDSTAAQKAMDAGQLSHYYIIDTHFMQTGDLTVIDKDFSPLSDISTMNIAVPELGKAFITGAAVSHEEMNRIAGIVRNVEGISHVDTDLSVWIYTL